MRALHVLAALAVCLLALPVFAADPMTPAQMRDLSQTIQVRKIFFGDPDLGPLNLGVRVRNRVATLWGPVPSVELALKAEARLRAIVEIVEVRNEMFVTSDELPRAKPGVRIQPRPKTEPLPLMPPIRGQPAISPGVHWNEVSDVARGGECLQRGVVGFPNLTKI